ncbi:LysR substrate-binding domain-containing protein [Nocardia sp. NPDC004278]
MHRDHRLALDSSTPVSALRDERWIAGSDEPVTTLLGAWHQAPWQPAVGHIARDWVTKPGLVAAGLSFTVVPESAVLVLPATISVVWIDDAAATRRTVLAHTAGGGPISPARRCRTTQQRTARTPSGRTCVTYRAAWTSRGTASDRRWRGSRARFPP